MTTPWILSGVILLGITAVLAAAFMWTQGQGPRALTPPEARAELHNKQIHAVIDVRTPAEFAAGHWHNAHSIPLDAGFVRSLPATVHDRSIAILFYCQTGRRAGRAARIAQELGYTNIAYLVDGTYADIEPRHNFLQH